MNSFRTLCVWNTRHGVVAIYGHQLQPQADLFFIAINVTAATVWLLPSGNAPPPDGKPSLLRLDLETSSVQFSP